MKNRILTLAYVLSIFIFWAFIHPESISYQEQYQLFLFDYDYLSERVSIVGGIANYIAEFVTQFYYINVVGALLLTVLYFVLQQVTLKVIKIVAPENNYIALSFLPGMLMIAHMGDENVLLSFLVSVIIATEAFVLLYKLPQNKRLYAEIVVIPFIYWIAGPVVFVLCLLLSVADIIAKYSKRSLVTICCRIIYTVLSVKILSYILMSQYPWPDVWFGVNYHRDHLVYPKMQFVVELIVAMLPLIAVLLQQIKYKLADIVISLVVFFIGIYGAIKCYDTDKYVQIKYDYWVRNEKWNNILNSAKKYMPRTSLACNSVNLALAMKGELNDRMFEYFQCGAKGLLATFERNMVSCVPTAEAYFRIGLTNQALRCFFDSQEAILNGQKSGRMEKRIAECYIIKGNYQIAQRHLSLLKKTLFYSNWAHEAEQCIKSETSVNNHPLYGRMRKMRPTEHIIFSQNDISALLAKMYEKNSNNKLAFSYMMANIMLQCDIQQFYYVSSWLKGRTIPRHCQEMIAMFWLQNIALTDLEPSEEMKRLVKSYDTAFLLTNDKNKILKSKKWGTTYWAYCTIVAPTLN